MKMSLSTMWINVLEYMAKGSSWGLVDHMLHGLIQQVAVIRVGPKSGLILDLRPANDRRRYKVMPSLIDWAQT